MTNHRPLRSRIASQIAQLATMRGGAPVIVVPGDVDGVDMRAVVSGLGAAMGYNVVLMLTAGFGPTAGFFAQPQPSTLAASERGRMHVLDERTGATPSVDEANSTAIIRHLDSGGGMPTPVVVIARGGVDAVGARAHALADALGSRERSVLPVD